MAIYDLDAAAPLISEPASGGAAELRAIKAAIKASFPNFGSGTDVTVATAAQMDNMAVKNATGTVSAVWTFNAAPVFNAGATFATVAATFNSQAVFNNGANFATGAVTVGVTFTYNSAPSFVSGATFSTGAVNFASGSVTFAVSPTLSAGATFNGVGTFNAGVTVATVPLSLLSGTQSAPGLTFTGDTNNGIYRPAADRLGLGTTSVEIGSSIGDNLVDIKFVDQTATRIWTIRRRTAAAANLFEIYRTVAAVDTQVLNINWSTGQTTFSTAPAVTSGGTLVQNTGTPVNNQLAVWTASATLEGVVQLTYDGTNVRVYDASAVNQARIAGASGFICRTSLSVGGFARGLLMERDSDGARTGGAGFHGAAESIQDFSIGFGSDWWSTNRVFYLLPSGDLSVTGTFSAASFPSPTLTGTVAGAGASTFTVPTVADKTDSSTKAASTAFVQDAVLNRYAVGCWTVADNTAIPGTTDLFTSLTLYGENDPGGYLTESGGEITVSYTGYYKLSYTLPVNSISATAHTVWACIGIDGSYVPSTIKAVQMTASGQDGILSGEVVLQLFPGQIISFYSRATTASRSEVGMAAPMDGIVARGAITVQRVA